ncbi:MAG: hypothetical protein WDM87_03960 [Terracidiphilus sp.]
MHAIDWRARRRESKHEPRQPASKGQKDKQSNPSALSGTPRFDASFLIDPPEQFNSYCSLQKNLSEGQPAEQRIVYIRIHAARQEKQKAGPQRIEADEPGKTWKPAGDASAKHRDCKRALQRQPRRPESPVDCQA